MPVDTHHYNDILNSAIITISGDAFHADLPDIDKDTWSAILYPKGAKDKDENQRLEFLGDAVMYLCIGLELYERYPDATPHFLTAIRQPLLTNLVFSMLIEKIDQRAARSCSILEQFATLRKQAWITAKQVRARIPKSTVKSVADTLEMVIGAVFLHGGLKPVRDWVSETYGTVITEAVKVWYHCKNPGDASASKKRKREDDTDAHETPCSKKRKKSSIETPKLKTPKPKTPKSWKERSHRSPTRIIYTPVHHKKSLPSTSGPAVAPPNRPVPIIIDLTNDDEDDSDEDDDGTMDAEGPTFNIPIWIDLTHDEEEDVSRAQSSSTAPDSSFSRTCDDDLGAGMINNIHKGTSMANAQANSSRSQYVTDTLPGLLFRHTGKPSPLGLHSMNLPPPLPHRSGAEREGNIYTSNHMPSANPYDEEFDSDYERLYSDQTAKHQQESSRSDHDDSDVEQAVDDLSLDSDKGTQDTSFGLLLAPP